MRGIGRPHLFAFAAWLVLIAVMARALVPAGFMPAVDGTLVICTLEGAKRVIIGADGLPHEAPEEDGRGAQMHGLCHFAGTHAAPVPGGAPGLEAPLHVRLTHRLEYTFFASVKPQLRLADARGPPSHA